MLLSPHPGFTSLLRALRGVLLAVLPAAAWASNPAAAAPQSEFESPWAGYEAGRSAYPGNPEPFERDPTALATADFDGDGDADVAVANYEFAAPGGGTDGLSGFALLRNEGDGSFAEAEHVTVSNQGCWDIVAADFDADGDADIAVSVANAFWEGQRVRLYRNDGAGGFTLSFTAVVQDGPLGLAAADFDGDGRRDLAVASYRSYEPNGAVSILRGNGAGGFFPPVVYLVHTRPFKLAAGDLDGDGMHDLAVAHEGQAVSLLFNDGTGAFGAPVAHTALYPLQGGMFYACITLADADRDGDLDVFYANTRSHAPGAARPNIVHLRNDGGTFTRAPDIPLTAYSAGPADLESGDLDGDGWPDLVGLEFSGRTGDGPRILLNDGAGGFREAVALPGGQATFAVALEDVEGDGDLDLLAADRYSMAVTVHRNPGSGLFPRVTRFDTAGLNIRMDTGDVDGDGDLDVFTSTEPTGSAGALLRNRGDGTFEAPVLYTHSSTYGRGASRAKLRDLDQDGDLDLLYNDAHTDFQGGGYNFYTAANDGAGQFGAIVEWFLGNCGTGDVDAFDLDGDGDLDVVNLEELSCGGGGADRLFISRNRGDGTFDPAYTIQIDTGPHALLGGDFNHDGRVDLVTTHWMPYGARDFLNVHIGNGDGTFQEEAAYTVGVGPRWIVSDDFDGDGSADLATANSGDGNEGRETLTVLFGDGAGGFGARTDYPAPFSPDLLGATGLAATDLEGDGDPDLILCTVANGAALYRNDGSGAFVESGRIGIWWDPWSVTAADFDGDGVKDLAAVTARQAGTSGVDRALTVLPGVGGAATGVALVPAGSGREGGIALSPPSPNPFGASASFTLAVREAQRVSLVAYDVAGRVAAVLHEGELAPGRPYRFTLDAAGLAAGVYHVRATGERGAAGRKAVLIR